MGGHRAAQSRGCCSSLLSLGEDRAPTSRRPRRDKCALMPSLWEIPFCTSSMLPQNAMGFHTVGLVQGLWVSFGFLVREEERDPRKGGQGIREFFEGLREELENLD